MSQQSKQVVLGLSVAAHVHRQLDQVLLVEEHAVQIHVLVLFVVHRHQSLHLQKYKVYTTGANYQP